MVFLKEETNLVWRKYFLCHFPVNVSREWHKKYFLEMRLFSCFKSTVFAKECPIAIKQTLFLKNIHSSSYLHCQEDGQSILVEIWSIPRLLLTTTTQKSLSSLSVHNFRFYFNFTPVSKLQKCFAQFYKVQRFTCRWVSQWI